MSVRCKTVKPSHLPGTVPKATETENTKGSQKSLRAMADGLGASQAAAAESHVQPTERRTPKLLAKNRYS